MDHPQATQARDRTDSSTMTPSSVIISERERVATGAGWEVRERYREMVVCNGVGGSGVRGIFSQSISSHPITWGGSAAHSLSGREEAASREREG